MGWVIESGLDGAPPDLGEVNNTGDIVETALILGRWGYTDYYHDAERILRCHLLPSQLRDNAFIQNPPNPDNEDGMRNVAERHLGASRGAEKIGDERKRGAAHIGEQQRRAARRDHPTVDLGRLEIRVDRCVDHREIAGAPQLVDKGAEVGERRVTNRHRGGRIARGSTMPACVDMPPYSASS